MFSLKLHRLQTLIRSSGVIARRKINHFSVPQQLPMTTRLLNQRPPQTFSENYNCSRLNYSSIQQNTPEILDTLEFENICEETLDHLTEYFEELVELEPSMQDADISYSSGVLTITLGDFGIYVINKQTPNKQIWLSSPTSGPKRFDFDIKEQFWVYSHTGESLHQVLQKEMPKIFKSVEQIDFSRCCYSKI